MSKVYIVNGIYLCYKLQDARAMAKQTARPFLAGLISTLLLSSPVLGLLRPIPIDVKPSSSSLSSCQQPPSNTPPFSMKVSYDGTSCTVPVSPGESILVAMERFNVAETLGLPEMPSDCRRGSCLTCSAVHAPDSQSDSLYRGDDGLSPAVSRLAAKKGFVLTCSSFVRGDGLHLQLAENHLAWNEIYRNRLEAEETQRVARKALARVLRKSAERNIADWTRETEEVYRQSLDH